MNGTSVKLALTFAFVAVIGGVAVINRRADHAQSLSGPNDNLASTSTVVKETHGGELPNNVPAKPHARSQKITSDSGRGPTTTEGSPDERRLALSTESDRSAPAATQSGVPAQPQSAETPEAIQPPIQWPIDTEGISGAVQEGLPEIRDCYKEWLKTNAALKGKVKVQFTIERDKSPEGWQYNRGKVTAVQIKDSTLKHQLLEGCVGSVMANLKFDAPQDGKTTVTYPVEFQPEE